MKAKWESKLLQGASQAVTASQTDQAVSEEWTPTNLDCERIVIAVKAADRSVTNAISWTLEMSPDGGITWVDAKASAVTISANGWSYMRLNPEVSADQAYLPLLPLLRVTVTSGASDSITITDVRVLQRG